MQWRLCLKICWRILNYHNLTIQINADGGSEWLSQINSYIWSVVEWFAGKRADTGQRRNVQKDVSTVWRTLEQTPF